jgi:tRNA-intron endonuclease
MSDSRSPYSAGYSSTDSGDFLQPIEVKLDRKELKIIVDNSIYHDQLRSRGFGEKEDSEYILRSYEALYLSYTKRLSIKDSGQMLDFHGLVRILLKHDKNLLTKFLIYRDLRSRGYIPKEGFGFGTDFRVYERGDFEKKPAKYVVFGISEGTKIRANILSRMIDQIGKMGKNAVVAVIERRGEVIYYKISKVAFPDNKNISSRSLQKTIPLDRRFATNDV